MGKIFIASDHAGYNLKSEIVKYLTSKELEFEDLGPSIGTMPVDYPDYAKKVVKAVKENEGAVGIVVCCTGIGMSMACNRFPNIRCALCDNTEIAYYSRLHNNSNVLALGAKFISTTDALKIVDTFIYTNFEGDRHIRRLEKLEDLTL